MTGYEWCLREIHRKGGVGGSGSHGVTFTECLGSCVYPSLFWFRDVEVSKKEPYSVWVRRPDLAGSTARWPLRNLLVEMNISDNTA